MGRSGSGNIFIELLGGSLGVILWVLGVVEVVLGVLGTGVVIFGT